MPDWLPYVIAWILICPVSLGLSFWAQAQEAKEKAMNTTLQLDLFTSRESGL